MKYILLLYIMLVSGAVLAQKTFSESVKMKEGKDISIPKDYAKILFKAKSDMVYGGYVGTLKIWNEYISYKILLKSDQELEQIIIKSGRYNVEAKLHKDFFTIIEKDFIVNSKEMKTLNFYFNAKEMPRIIPPPVINIRPQFKLQKISSEFSPIESNEKYSKEVHKDSCLLKLNFTDYNDRSEVENMKIFATYYPIDPDLEITKINAVTKNGRINIKVKKAGKLVIKFKKSCAHSTRKQIETDFKNSGTVKKIILDLTCKTTRRHPVKKPVIYAYSEKDIDVDFTLKTNAELEFTYPKYDKKWSTKVLASGGFEVNNKKYPYLFWEGNLNLSKHIEHPKVGFIIKKEAVISFLENTLSKIGLNSTEKTDFITFWAPQMMEADSYYIKFLIDEDYNNSISSLNSSVKPDSEIRVFMIYSPNPNFTNIKAQTFTNHIRKGFTVVEWGGSEISK